MSITQICNISSNPASHKQSNDDIFALTNEVKRDLVIIYTKYIIKSYIFEEGIGFKAVAIT